MCWSWGSSLGADMKNNFFDMDGNKVTSITTGQWYKIILPKVKGSGVDPSWDLRSLLTIDAQNGEREVYFRNVSFGDTLPDGWVNA